MFVYTILLFLGTYYSACLPWNSAVSSSSPSMGEKNQICYIWWGRFGIIYLGWFLVYISTITKIFGAWGHLSLCMVFRLGRPFLLNGFPSESYWSFGFTFLLRLKRVYQCIGGALYERGTCHWCLLFQRSRNNHYDISFPGKMSSNGFGAVMMVSLI